MNQIFEIIKQNETVCDFVHAKSEIRVTYDMGHSYKTCSLENSFLNTYELIGGTYQIKLYL